MTTEEIFELNIESPDGELVRRSRERWDCVAKPIRGLGVMEELVTRIAAAQGKLFPDIRKKAHIIMCADNGVFVEGVSQTGQSVTRDVAALMGKGRSSVCVMAKDYPVDLFIYDVGINSAEVPEGLVDAKRARGTADFVREPAMSEEVCLAAISTGIEAVKKISAQGYGIISTGEMGIGNTTTSTALLCALNGLAPAEVTGRGAGLSDEGLRKKIDVIERGLTLHRGERAAEKISSKEEAFEALRCLGGLDIAGLAGVFIGGALCSIPIVIDGLISAAAALCAELMVPGVKEFMLASHMGREKAMEAAMRRLDLKAVIHAELALGEGTGAVLSLPMLDMALNLYSKGISFEEMNLERYERFDR